MIINVTIKNKQAFLPVPAVIVCGNKDYKINFSFDEEWEERKTKTARFFYNGTYEERLFTGNTCDVPVLSNTTGVFIGVFSGDIYTTTPAYIPCEKSILCLGGAHAEPPEDVYNQIIELINELQLEKGKPSNELPLMDGEASAGTNIEYSRADHVHPTDDTRASAKALTEETERAQTAEEANATAIAEEAARATAAEEANATAIAEETARATVAEEANATAIAEEVARATAAEEALTNIITEEVARQDEDIANATETANEAKETADTLDNTIQFALSHSTETREMLNEEISRSTVKDQALEDALADFEQRVNALLESDDETLNELQEVVDYIKNNKDLIEAITISKVSVSDIVDNLNSTATNKPLSANQGRVLKGLIEDIQSIYSNKVAQLEAADTENANAIIAERNRASLAEQANADAIEAEETRAKTAEATLTTEVQTANEHAQNAVEVATATLDTASRAKAISEQTQANLETEIVRAQTAEQTNATAIAEETERAQTAEQANATAIAEETQRAQTAEQANATAIAEETERAQTAEQANATAIAEETERAKEAEAKCVQQVTYSTTSPEPSFDDYGNCARAYVRTRNDKEDSFLVSKYPTANAIPLRNNMGNLITYKPIGVNECANKQYVDDEIAEAQKNIVQSDYRENDTSKGSYIVNRPFLIGDEVESSHSADRNNYYAFNIPSLNGSLQFWYWIGYPKDYASTDITGDTWWARKFLDDLGSYTITVEQDTQCQDEKTRDYYLADATYTIHYGSYIVEVDTDYKGEYQHYQKMYLFVVDDAAYLNDIYHSSFKNGVYLCRLNYDCSAGGTIIHGDTLTTTTLEKRVVQKVSNSFLNLQNNAFLLQNLLNFKRATVSPNGGKFLLKPGMIAMIFPWNNSTTSFRSPSEVIYSSIGTSLVFTTDRTVGDTYDVALITMKSLSATSHHNTYPLTDSDENSCYIQNDYEPGTSGETGYTYVYYLERG